MSNLCHVEEHLRKKVFYPFVTYLISPSYKTRDLL
jgi:hypothetical protein